MYPTTGVTDPDRCLVSLISLFPVFARAVFVPGSERVVRWEGVSFVVLHQLHGRGYRGASETDRHFLLRQTPPARRLDNAVP